MGDDMFSTKEFLGQRIKEIRKARNLTQAKLAELVGVDSKYISRLETGNSYPSLDTLENIAGILNADVKEFFNILHFKEKDILIDEISKKLLNTNKAKVKLIYQIINDILNAGTID